MSSGVSCVTGLVWKAQTQSVGPQSLTHPCPLCVPWQMQSNLLEQISAYNMGQFSQLVSAVIVKSWPVRAGQSEGDFDTILHHLLTWPDIKHIFSFNGRSVVGFLGGPEKLFSASLLPLHRTAEGNCPALVSVPVSKLELFGLGEGTIWVWRGKAKEE